MANLERRVKKLETELTRVVKTQGEHGTKVASAIKRLDRLVGAREKLGLPSGQWAPISRRTKRRWMRFEFSEGRSDKFWEIRLEGSSFITHWGRIGLVGQETKKRYATPAAAAAEGERLIAAKLKKGYQLVR